MLNNVKLKLLLIVFTLYVVPITEAQKLYFEPQIGSAYVGYWGENLIADSIKVEANNQAEKAIIVELNTGYKFTGRLEGVLAITLFTEFPSYSVYNQSPNSKIGAFTVVKGGSQFIFDFQISLMPKFALVKRKNMKVYAFVAPSVHFTTNKDGDFVPFNPYIDFKGQLPTVAKVLNSLKEASGKTFFSYSYGASVYYKKFSFTVKYTQNISNTFTNNLVVEGVSFPFINTFNRLSFTLGYQFYFKKKENKNLD